MREWVFVELGGSSAQSTGVRDGAWVFTDGVTRRAGVRYALAVPGVIRAPKVLYATNLGWPDVADPAHELALGPVEVLENDAVAAALGESVLRADGTCPDLLYVALGTGVGTALVRNGRAADADMGHIPVGGNAFCASCRAHGCLNSVVEARQLSHPVTGDEVATVVSALLRALDGLRARGPVPSLLVLSGGIVVSTPMIPARLAERTRFTIEPSRAASGAKSAAYAGLSHLAGLAH